MSKKFWITKSRYVRQVHDAQPHYITASPHNPVLVEMADDVRPDRGMKAEKEAAPEKPLTGFVKKQSSTTRSEKQKPKDGKRAADQ